MSRSEEALVDALSPLCDALGARLYDVEIAQGALRVVVEGDDGGLDLDVLSGLARQVSAFLDEHDELALPDRYELEVGSPGLERRLRTRSHLARAVGERVAIRLRPGFEGDRRLEGVLESASGDDLVVRCDDGTTRPVAFADLERARTVFDWRRAFAEDKRERSEKHDPSGDTKRKVGRS